MRSALLVVLALAVGCADRMDPESIHIPRRLDVNVLASPDLVLVYVRELDRPCVCEWGEFPAAEGCVGHTDTVSCSCNPAPGTCFTSVALERNGATFPAREHVDGDYYSLPIDAPSTDPIELVLEGCEDDARIPLHVGGPVPTASASWDSRRFITAQWTLDRPAASTLVTLSDSGNVQQCRTTELAVTFPYTQFVNEMLGVMALDPPEVVDVPLGSVTVYPAGHTTMTFSVPP